MGAETVALLGGLLFLLLAIVGGGFTVKEIIMPRVPIWARLVCLLVGAVLVVPYFLGTVGSAQSGVTVAAAEPRPAPPAGQTVLFSEAESTVSADGIEVSGLLATAERKPPVVGDRIEIQFSLENAGSGARTFEEAFIGGRNPGWDNKDFGHENTGVVISPGKAVRVSHSIVVDAAGTWEFWPCYSLRERGEVTLCPDEWRSFQVLVESR
jgi:hypothetical protein